ncbi:hypothetical protein FS594_24660 (plasmid) [Rahnella aquatilis]|nr:hypothetical protein FS594_24660 [Rahnella aquatilis]
MDFLYIVRFVWLNIQQGRIPLIDDIRSFSKIYPEHGTSSVVIFSTSLLLNVSIIFSVIVLVKKWKGVNFLIYLQIPFRLLLLTPSLSFLPWLFKSLGISSVLVLILAVIVSEIIKVYSLKVAQKSV